MRPPRRWAGDVALAALVLALLVLGYVLLWGGFMVYDDEGYVLYSLRAFARQGGLYDQVYSQYGPFFFLLFRGLHGLGLAFTHTMAREFVLICWSGTAAACAALVHRETRGNLVATAVTLAGVFLYLWPMISEPSHPGALVALLVAGAAWCGTHPRWPVARRAVAVGAIGGLLALTKINIGIFLLASAGAWWVLQLPAARPHRWIRWTTAAVLALLPFALMRPFLIQPWVLTYAVVAAAGAVAIVAAMVPTSAEATSWRVAVRGGSAIVAVVALVAALTLAMGTSAAGLLDGVLLRPLHQPMAYFNATDWLRGARWAALASAALALACVRLPLARTAWFIVAGRLALVVAYLVVAMAVLTFDGTKFVMSYAIATAWIFVRPVREADATQPARNWLALLLVMQALHGYPVAGSQLAWGTFLWIPLAVLGTYEVVCAARHRWTRFAATAAATVVVAIMVAQSLRIGWTRYRDEEELRLPGAEHVRTGTWHASALRMIARNIAVHGDVLFSIPGLMSFNLWTDTPPPTAANATQWFTLLSPSEQERIFRRLQAAPRAVIVMQRRVYDDLTRLGLVPHTPLLTWVLENFEPRFSVETYEFWVRKHRPTLTIDAADLLVSANASAPKYRLEVITAMAQPAEVDRIELCQLRDDTAVPTTQWDNGNARFLLSARALDGAHRGVPTEHKLPITLSGVAQLTVLTDHFPAHFATDGGIVYLIGAKGERVGEARFVREISSR